MSLRTLAANSPTLRIASRPVARLVAVAFALAAVATIAGLSLSLRGHASGSPTGQSALDALVQRAGSAVVFSEFGVDGDTFWAANAADPADRVQIGVALHATGYSVFPSLSPDGAYVAYTAIMSGSPGDPSGEGQLWLMDTATGKSRLLADNVDLRSVPVWSPASDAVVVRRSPSGEGQLLRVALGGSASPIAQAAGGLYAIGFTPEGESFYYATLSASGVDLLRASLSAAGAASPSVEGHLSDGVARDWHLSPDGNRLAYLAQSADGGYTALVLDLASGGAGSPLGEAGGAEFNPIWDPSGLVTIGRLSERAAVRLSSDGSAGAALPSPASGFDVPISWSPDGSHLIVRAFSGDSTADPGPSRLVAIDASGARHELSPESDVEIAGWLASP